LLMMCYGWGRWVSVAKLLRLGLPDGSDLGHLLLLVACMALLTAASCRAAEPSWRRGPSLSLLVLSLPCHSLWPADTNLLYLLLDKLQAGQAVEAQSNSAEILAALAQSQVSPLTRNLADPAFLELLVQRALPDQGVASSAPGGGGDTAGSRTPDKLAGGGSPPATIVTAANGDGAEPPAQCKAAASDASPSEPLPKSTAGGAATGEAAAADGEAGSSDIGDSVSGGADSAPGGSALMHARVHALNVCIALVEPLPPSPADQQAAAAGLSIGAAPSPGIDTAAAEVHAAMRGQATRCVAKYMHRLVALLESADPSRRLPTSYGLLHPPVGLARLKAMELLAALLHSGDETAGACGGSLGGDGGGGSECCASCSSVLQRVACVAGAAGACCPHRVLAVDRQRHALGGRSAAARTTWPAGRAAGSQPALLQASQAAIQQPRLE
jgi:hypothetical protein